MDDSKLIKLIAVTSMLLLIIASFALITRAQETQKLTYGYQGKEGPYDRKVGPAVLYIKITGVIDTAMQDYVEAAIRDAERLNVPLVIILDTPGGLLDSARNIVLAIDEARIPVIGYVERGWALSAGTLILVSTHIAAMAPGTQIGSMQPVMYDPTSGTYEPVNESKIINPILEFLDEHAVSKGRNKTQIYRFVTHNDNLGAYDALEYNVIEFVAKDLNDLLRQINGSIVLLGDGSRVKLVLDGTASYYSPGLRVIILHILSDPLLSGILLSLGMLIILFTLASGHPGLAPIGALLLLLGLAGTGFSPNYTALFLLMLGALLIFIEINTPGFGVIGGTGIVMIILGIALLPVSASGFTVSLEYARRILYTLYASSAILGGFGAIAVYKIIQVRKRPPIVWSIVGAKGRAIDEIMPGKPGFVIVEGEYWKAISDDHIKPGDPVEVVGKEESILKVRKASDYIPHSSQPSS
ncbi:MAG: nodulation protein NfeD [Desulfurococcales archaeon]|nr:nodulation protein NfeD [Desulfurococcales archaeon]